MQADAGSALTRREQELMARRRASGSEDAHAVLALVLARDDGEVERPGQAAAVVGIHHQPDPARFGEERSQLLFVAISRANGAP